MTGGGLSEFDRERFGLLYRMVEAWWKLPRGLRDEFRSHRPGNGKENLYHGGFPGNSIPTEWPLLRSLEADKYLAISPGPQGDSLIHLRAKAFQLFDAANHPPEPETAKRKIGFDYPGSS